MSYKSIKKELRDSVKAHLESQAGADLSGETVVSSMAGSVLTDRHIRIVTPSATPHIQGSTNLGRWTIDLQITVVSQIDDTTEDQHDNLVGLVEAYVLQGNSTLAGFWSNADIDVDVVQPTESTEIDVEGLRYSASGVSVECRLTGV